MSIFFYVLIVIVFLGLLSGIFTGSFQNWLKRHRRHRRDVKRRKLHRRDA